MKTLACLLSLPALLGSCAREYVPVLEPLALVAPMIYYNGRMSRPAACARDRIYFARGSAEISPESAACLRAKLEWVGIIPNWIVLAFADRTEGDTAEARMALARRRAENVVEFFRAYGLVSLSKRPAMWFDDGYVDRAPWMTAEDFHQEYRIVLVHW